MGISSSAPWLKYYGEVPHHLQYPQKTIFQMVKAAADKYPKLPAYEFMIVTSGYNVYPGQLENIIDGHDKVLISCVIGVKDPYKMQKVKAFVVLRPGFQPSEQTKREILDYCSGRIAKYAMLSSFLRSP